MLKALIHPKGTLSTSFPAPLGNRTPHEVSEDRALWQFRVLHADHQPLPRLHEGVDKDIGWSGLFRFRYPMQRVSRSLWARWSMSQWHARGLHLTLNAAAAASGIPLVRNDVISALILGTVTRPIRRQ